MSYCEESPKRFLILHSVVIILPHIIIYTNILKITWTSTLRTRTYTILPMYNDPAGR